MFLLLGPVNEFIFARLSQIYNKIYSFANKLSLKLAVMGRNM
jgi:hypothetical protein